MATPKVTTPRCGARLRSKAERPDATCRKPAGWGTQHEGIGNCKLHGGGAPSHMVHASRVITERALAAIKDTHPTADPLEALARLSGSLERSADYLSERIGDELVDERGRPSPLYDMWSKVVTELRQTLAATTRATIAHKVELTTVGISLDGDLFAQRVLSALAPWPDAAAAVRATFLDVAGELE